MSILLVPLDGSSMAEEALPAAVAIAHRTRARLHLATVIQPVPALLATGEEPAVAPELEQELQDEAGEYLGSAAEALGTTHGLEVSYAVLDGSPAQALADHARAKRVGLIVMTTHGHTGLNRLWLGSVADRLLRWVKVPVLLLRPKDGSSQTASQAVLVVPTRKEEE